MAVGSHLPFDLLEIQARPASEGQAAAFWVPAWQLQTPSGPQWVVNPKGQQLAPFSTLEAAILAVEAAGFTPCWQGQVVGKASLLQPQTQSGSKKTPPPSESPLVQAQALLLQRLKDREKPVVTSALAALGAMAGAQESFKPAFVLDAATLTPPLLLLLEDEDPEVRRELAKTLAQLGPEVLPFLNTLYQEALTPGQTSFSYIGPKKGEAHRLRFSLMGVYKAFAQRYGLGLGQALWPALLQGLQDEAWLVRSAAAEAVGALLESGAVLASEPSKMFYS